MREKNQQHPSNTVEFSSEPKEEIYVSEYCIAGINL